MINALPALPKPLQSEMVDGENNPVMVDSVYALRREDDVAGLVAAIRSAHGQDVLLLPLSARSGGSGIFQVTPPAGQPVAGIAIEPATTARVSTSSQPALADIALDEVIICPERNEILAGAGITLDQLNRALNEALGAGYRVLGADLTSYTYAQVGATYLTGGMGPQRRYFSDSVIEAVLFDGDDFHHLLGAAVDDHAGTYGWSGLVTGVRCRYVNVPPREIAFALPADSDPRSLAALLDRLAPWCFLDPEGSSLVNRSGGNNLIMGIEHVTIDAMGPMLAAGADNAINRRAAILADKCRSAGCDGLVFVNGYIVDEPEEFLASLLDNADGDSLTIAGIDLAHSELFDDPEVMRAVREAIPAAARTQAPRGRFVFKGHTDATIRLDPDNVADGAGRLWQINRTYVAALSEFFANHGDVDGQVLVYGHMNPWGVDPHNRLTFASNDQKAYEEAVNRVHGFMADFYSSLNQLCVEGQGQFIGGEKGAASEREILTAFPDMASAPATLVAKLGRQQQVIREAPQCFNWRALPPYGSKL